MAPNLAVARKTNAILEGSLCPTLKPTYDGIAQSLQHISHQRGCFKY